MGRISILLSILLAAIVSQAAQINMYESGYPIGVQPVQTVAIKHSWLAHTTFISVYSRAVPCANYPGNVDGDVYSCTFDKSSLANITGKKEVLQMDANQIRNFILSTDFTFNCNTPTKPQLIRYQGKSVYHFDGTLFVPTNKN